MRCKNGEEMKSPNKEAPMGDAHNESLDRASQGMVVASQDPAILESAKLVGAKGAILI